VSTAISRKPVLFQCRWFVCEPAERDIPQYEGAPAVPRIVLAHKRLTSLSLSARHTDSFKHLANQFLTRSIGLLPASGRISETEQHRGSQPAERDIPPMKDLTPPPGQTREALPRIVLICRLRQSLCARHRERIETP
jgi:hypothetical protein